MIYLGVFATALATLILEVALTRLFSIAFWYHFAFLVISIALLGFGASGTFLTIFSSLLNKPNRSLSWLSLIFSISIITVFIICRQIPFDPARISWDSRQILYILLYSFLLSIPFFFAGLTLSVAISHAPQIVNRIYFSDLSGAGLGALSVSILFPFLEGSGVIIFASLMAAMASFFFSFWNKNVPSIDGQKFLTVQKINIFLRIICIIIIFIILIVKPQNIINYINIPISPYKDLKTALLYPEARILKTDWNSFSRVDVIESPAVRYAPGLSLEYRRPLPSQIGITEDGSGLNAITEYKKNPPISPLLKGGEGGLRGDLEFIPYLPSYLPYYIRHQTSDSKPQTSIFRNHDILIIEPGGGLPVLMALKGLFESPSPQSSPLMGEGGEGVIDIVERNPLLVRLIKDDFGYFSGDIYKDRRVRVFIEEGRTFLRKEKKSYDIIDLSMPGTISPTSTGLYGLLEDYTFTVEAFEELIRRLKENGVISITRYILPPPREEARIISLALNAFRRFGIEDPSDRIAAIRSWGTVTILIKKTPFEDFEIERIKEFSKSRRFDIVYFKGLRQEETNIYNVFREDPYFKTFNSLIDSEKRETFYKDYLFDLRPTTDDRPFFFHFFRINKITPVYQSMKEKWQPFIEGGYIVPVMLIESLVLSLILIILPLLWMRRDKSDTRKGQKLKIILYFISIGLGFMFIEIAMIQKFILFLGKPVYSISLVIFSILISTAGGSFFSMMEGITDIISIKKRIKTAVIVIIIILTVYYLFLDKLLILFLGEDFIIRSLIAFFIIAPLGFFMGFLFPSGIRVTDLYDRRLIPWAWASNGCASVVATSLSVMLAISFGFSTVLLLAGCIYLFGFTALFGKRGFLNLIMRGSNEDGHKLSF